jgi:hypothetical protein
LDPICHHISVGFHLPQGFLNEGLKSMEACLPGHDCAKNTLYVNPNYGEHVWDSAARNWKHDKLSV